MSPATPAENPLQKVVLDTKGEIKPRLRGWLHASAVPLSLVGGVLLIVYATTTLGRIGAIVYLAASILLFGTSATYHRFGWGQVAAAILRRMDHSNIYLFIAATYTPLALLLLTGTSRVLLLTLIWSEAVAGVLFRVLWLSAPRWLYTVLYIGMGWAAVAWLPQLWSSGGPLVIGLIGAGGLIYTAGAVVYALKRPNPWPMWFGFHEIFHACTVLAAGCHYAAIALITFR
ncbi:MAG TPA: hemolysin III family protein [Propionibacteriaceae bacterium]|nr:hemolysin III family protein [Propionibacteriaceae bacterium]